jgi:hypothetical protein
MEQAVRGLTCGFYDIVSNDRHVARTLKMRIPIKLYKTSELAPTVSSAVP